jgi:hypothetical protein
MEPQSKFWPGFEASFTSKKYMKASPELEGLSVTSVLLHMYFREQLLAKGTGWFSRTAAGVALVTAWHNFSGLHHTTRTALDSHGGMPDRVYFRYMAKNPATFQDANVLLYLDEENTQPRWLVHPLCGNFFDMAYLPLNFAGGDVNCVNDFTSIKEDRFKPGEDVFAIGYPQGVATLNLFPIWKRGSVASEPDVPVNGYPKFYIDLSGRGGLSGAPVFRIQRGWIFDRDRSGQNIRIGEKLEFVGLYSGRAADQLPIHLRTGESTDLGFVWRADIVREMLSGGTPDEQPEVGKGVANLQEFWGDDGALEIGL